MTPELIPINPTTRNTLLELAARSGKPAGDVLAAAVEEYRLRHGDAVSPIAEIPGVNPADVWEAAAQAEAGRLTAHDELFTRLRSRP